MPELKLSAANPGGCKRGPKGRHATAVGSHSAVGVWKWMEPCNAGPSSPGAWSRVTDREELDKVSCRDLIHFNIWFTVYISMLFFSVKMNVLQEIWRVHFCLWGECSCGVCVEMCFRHQGYSNWASLRSIYCISSFFSRLCFTFRSCNRASAICLSISAKFTIQIMYISQLKPT